MHGRAQIHGQLPARHAELYDWAPEGYCTLDRSCSVIEANLTAAGMLGVERGLRHAAAAADDRTRE